MEYPYMPIGETDHEGQKRKTIEHAIQLLKTYEDDNNVKKSVEILLKSLE